MNSRRFGRACLFVVLILSSVGPVYADGYKDTTKNLSACFKRHYDPAEDTSSDGGRSAMKLLSACPDEWDAAAHACALEKGKSLEDCNADTGMLAQSYLLLKEAGAPD